MPAPPPEAALGTPALDAADRRLGDLPPGRPDARRPRRAVPRDRDERDRRSASSHSNFPAYDGQWRQAAWALVARGARMVEYWHWHSIHFGHEAYWLGVLNHDGEPGPLLRRGQADRRRLQPRRRRGGRPRPRRRRRRCSTRARASGRWSSIPRSRVEGGLEPDRGLLRADLRALLRGPVRRRPAGRHRLPAAARQRRRRARGALAGARRPRALRRRRRAAGPARRLRAGGRAPRARLPQRLRRRRGATARGGHAGPAARGGGRELRRVHEPRRPGAAAVGRGLRPARRGGRDGLGGRARAGGRRDARWATSTRTSGAGRR